jgi:hypothetical protein
MELMKLQAHRKIILFCIIGSLILFYIYNLMLNVKQNELVSQHIVSSDQSFHKWAKFQLNSNEQFDNKRQHFRDQCLKDDKLSIENLQNVLNALKNKDECRSYYDYITDLYEFVFKDNHIFMKEELVVQVKQWLNNDDNLLKEAYNQVNIN